MIENIQSDGLYNESYKKIMSEIEYLRSKQLTHGFALSMAGTGSLVYTIFDIILSPFKNIKKIQVPTIFFLKKLQSYLRRHRKILVSYINYVWTKDIILSSTLPYPVRRTEYPWAVLNAKLDKPIKILDVGSGVSMLPIYLASKGHKVYSIDNDKILINRVCPKLAEYSGVNVNYNIGDAIKINFDDNSFDRVFCVSVLEHLEEEVGNRQQTDFHKKNLDIKAIKEMLRVLKPHGLLMLTLDWSENPNDHRSYTLDDIYGRLLKDYHSLLVVNKKPQINWDDLKRKHLEAEKAFPPYNYLVEGWAIGIVLQTFF